MKPAGWTFQPLDSQKQAGAGMAPPDGETKSRGRGGDDGTNSRIGGGVKVDKQADATPSEEVSSRINRILMIVKSEPTVKEPESKSAQRRGGRGGRERGGKDKNEKNGSGGGGGGGGDRGGEKNSNGGGKGADKGGKGDKGEKGSGKGSDKGDKGEAKEGGSRRSRRGGTGGSKATADDDEDDGAEKGGRAGRRGDGKAHDPPGADVGGRGNRRSPNGDAGAEAAKQTAELSRKASENSEKDEAKRLLEETRLNPNAPVFMPQAPERDLPPVVLGEKENEFIGLQYLAEMGYWVVLKQNIPGAEPFFWHRWTNEKRWEAPEHMKDLGITEMLKEWAIQLPVKRNDHEHPELWPEPVRISQNYAALKQDSIRRPPGMDEGYPNAEKGYPNVEVEEKAVPHVPRVVPPPPGGIGRGIAKATVVPPPAPPAPPQPAPPPVLRPPPGFAAAPGANGKASGGAGTAVLRRSSLEVRREPPGMERDSEGVAAETASKPQGEGGGRTRRRRRASSAGAARGRNGGAAEGGDATAAAEKARSGGSSRWQPKPAAAAVSSEKEVETPSAHCEASEVFAFDDDMSGIMGKPSAKADADQVIEAVSYDGQGRKTAVSTHKPKDKGRGAAAVVVAAAAAAAASTGVGGEGDS
eukprot:gnl/TRDRNA2_/TRDRNA2_44425_c0_seq1.p1 gnl/TRDRNA2_/TRDRNA2_44425_c0~~gnl/TRDRNA2_/TRDRNA2_44425_c0_seq1.p1  ORF type:complete len:640 (+),score=147.18 gnl/TRDRNA2_/TRDRNA2_44425_c0_seq1:92-2011(+)